MLNIGISRGDVHMKMVSAKDINKVISIGNLFLNPYYSLLYSTPEGDLLYEIRTYKEKKATNDRLFDQIAQTFGFNTENNTVSIINDEPLFD